MRNLTETVDLKQLQEGVFSSTRNIWLAGLGVFSAVKDEGQTVFDELVERGKKVEERGRKSLKKTRKEIESTTDGLTDRLDHSVSEVLHRMGVPSRTQVEDLTERVEKLTGQVERLAKAGKKPASRPRAKKTAARAA